MRPLPVRTPWNVLVNALVLAEEIADLSAAYADIAGGNVHIGANIFVKLSHEALAEAHNFPVRFALRVKVAAALAAADRKAGKRVFKDLLKAQEFDDALG